MDGGVAKNLQKLHRSESFSARRLPGNKSGLIQVLSILFHKRAQLKTTQKRGGKGRCEWYR